MSTSFPWITMLAVALGAAVGAVLRWVAALWMNPAWHGFPLGTLLVNCAGGFMIGGALLGFERWPSELVRALFVTGFLGGLTTFSAFSGESMLLLQRGQWLLSVLHAAAHVFGALACTALGYGLARALLEGPGG
jgi:fluoride exporter